MLGERIKAFRHERGVTQTALAKRANVALGDIGMMETGKRQNSSLDMLNRLAKALEVTVGDLLK